MAILDVSGNMSLFLSLCLSPFFFASTGSTGRYIICAATVCICFRYKRAHEALYGSNLDIATRFDVKEDERGILLLNKIWDVYQDAWGSANVGPSLYGHFF